MIGSACGMCCVFFGGKARLRKKYERMQPTKPTEKYFAWFLFFLPLFVISISAAAHIGGINYSNQGLYAAEDSSVAMIDHSSQLLGNSTIVLGTIVDNLKTSVKSAVDTTVNSVNINEMDNSVVPPLQNLVAEFTNLRDQVAALKVTRDNLATSIGTLQTSATTLETSINGINTNIQSLSTTNQPITGSAGKFWILKAAVAYTQPSATQLKNRANAAPNVNTILAGLDSVPDLNTYIDNSQAGVTNLKTNTSKILSDTATLLKNDLEGPLDNAKLDTIDLLDPAVTQGKTMLNNAKASLQAQYVTVNGHNDTRVIVQYLLVLLYALPILVITMMGVSKKPRIMKTCNLISVPYYFLLYILAVIFFILAVIVGDGCDLIFDTSSQFAANVAPIQIGLSAYEQCSNGTSLLSIASSLGVGLNTSQFNLTQIAGEKIDAVNFNTASDFDLS